MGWKLNRDICVSYSGVCWVRTVRIGWVVLGRVGVGVGVGERELEFGGGEGGGEVARGWGFWVVDGWMDTREAVKGGCLCLGV